MTAATDAISAKPGRIAGVLVPLLALAIFINYVDRGNLATAAPLIKAQLNISNTAFGVLVSAFFWIYAPGQVLAAWMAQKFNAYRTLTIGLALWSIATMLSGFATGFAMLLALRVLLGLGESVGFPASSKLMAQNLPPHLLGFSNGLITAGLMLGPAAGTFFGGLLIAHAGWRVLFISFGALSLLWLIPWLMNTRRLSADAHTLATAEPSFAKLLARRELWGTAIGHFCANYPFYLVLSWLPLYLVKVHGFTLTQMAQLGGLVYVLSAAFVLVFGYLADRWMAHGGSSTLVRKTMACVGGLATMTCMLACAEGDVRLAIAGLLLSSVGNGLTTFNLYAIGQTLAGPKAAGKWMGLQNGLGNISGIIGPIFTGWVVDVTGQFGPAFLAAAVVALIGVFCWLVVIPKIEPLDWDAGAPG
jgi:MFS family permease